MVVVVTVVVVGTVVVLASVVGPVAVVVVLTVGPAHTPHEIKQLFIMYEGFFSQ